MTTLYVREYPDMPQAFMGLPAAKEPGTDQTVTFTTSTQSAAFASTTFYVRILSTGNAHIVFGANPTATTGAAKIIANTAEYFRVTPGHKVAAIDGA